MTARRTELLAVGALAVVAVVFWALVPTYPNYDAYYHLVWGREVVHGHAPTFEAYQAPTEHPLYLAICAVVTLVAVLSYGETRRRDLAQDKGIVPRGDARTVETV